VGEGLGERAKCERAAVPRSVVERLGGFNGNK
jgi:hypothetical protein